MSWAFVPLGWQLLSFDLSLNIKKLNSAPPFHKIMAIINIVRCWWKSDEMNMVMKWQTHGQFLLLKVGLEGSFPLNK